jgi:hypothetical protein
MKKVPIDATIRSQGITPMHSSTSQHPNKFELHIG